MMVMGSKGCHPQICFLGGGGTDYVELVIFKKQKMHEEPLTFSLTEKNLRQRICSRKGNINTSN